MSTPATIDCCFQTSAPLIFRSPGNVLQIDYNDPTKKYFINSWDTWHNFIRLNAIREFEGDLIAGGSKTLFGDSFKRFRSDTKEATWTTAVSIPGNIAIDSTGTAWGALASVNADGSTGAGLPGSDGSITGSCYDDKVVSSDATRTKINVYEAGALSWTKTVGGTVTSLSIGPDGTVWIARFSVPVPIFPLDFQIRIERHDETTMLASHVYNAHGGTPVVCALTDGSVVVSQPIAGAASYNFRRTSTGGASWFVFGNHGRPFTDQNGMLFFHTSGGGVGRINPATGLQYAQVNQFTSRYFTEATAAHAVDGVVWIGGVRGSQQ